MRTVIMMRSLGFRRKFRRRLQRHSLAFVEDKGWIDSQFVVTGSFEAIDAMLAEEQ